MDFVGFHGVSQRLQLADIDRIGWCAARSHVGDATLSSGRTHADHVAADCSSHHCQGSEVVGRDGRSLDRAVVAQGNRTIQTRGNGDVVAQHERAVSIDLVVVANRVAVVSGDIGRVTNGTRTGTTDHIACTDADTAVTTCLRAMADGNGVVFTRQSQIANRYRIVDAQGAEGHTACNYFTGCIVIDGGSCDFGACQVAQCYVAIARDRTASIVTRRRIVTADHITARAIARQRIEITH